jgi:hypothetical protein
LKLFKKSSSDVTQKQQSIGAGECVCKIPISFVISVSKVGSKNIPYPDSTDVIVPPTSHFAPNDIASFT